MPTTERLSIAVIGNRDSVTPEIAVAWGSARVSLQGPFPISSLEGALGFSSAIIDIRYDAETVFRLTDRLDAESIPYIFFVPKAVIDSRPGSFVLSDLQADIECIVAALTEQQATRH